MNEKGLFYGSSSGNTQSVAGMIARGLGIEGTDVIDVSKATPEMLRKYDILILGSSTWGLGDLQDDWEDFIGALEKADLSGKKVAVFGTGDSSSYPDSFCDAIGLVAEAAEKAGATLIGTEVDASGYVFDSSKALRDDTFCGLPLDEDNEADKTGERVDRWVEKLKAEFD